ncbi:MAG: hypothetical protein ACT6FE_01065 [Methanosarcinaceae archaeon]
MKTWKIGAIVGTIFGLMISYIPLLWWYGGGHIISFIPPIPSLYSFGIYLGLFLSATFGMLIGAGIGYLINKYKRYYEN